MVEAHALADAGRYSESLALVEESLRTRRNDAELLFARASTWFDWGRIREARAGFLQAEVAGLARPSLYLNLAWCAHLLGLTNDAEHYARKAIAVDPSSGPAHFGLGTVLQRLKRYPEAIASYERALELSPDTANCTAGIAYCKLEQHDFAEAEVWLRRAIELAPENPQSWTNLGVALASNDRYAEALDAFGRAGELESALGVPAESTVDLAYTYILTGNDAVVVDFLQERLPHLPDPRAHGHYAFALLTLGRFREGWAQYEARWLQDPHLSNRPNFTQPVWAGQDLAGKTILLRAEQGAGDIVQFARYALPLKAMGAAVVLQVRTELLDLARGFAGVDQVFAPPMPEPSFDYYAHIMGLPHAFGTEIATIPAEIPYLRVNSAKATRWAARLGGSGFKVGIAWSGNPLHPRDRFRSMALDDLRELWDVQGVRWFSLQKQPKPGELERVPAEIAMSDLSADLVDFGDTAAAIAHMDLVLCVDTAVAHMAGALGKPVWLLLPRVGDFRWLTERDDSPWYPTMRLFRQRELGQWGEVIARVKAVLERTLETVAIAGGGSAQPAGSRSEPVDVVPRAGTETERARISPPGIARVAETRHGVVQYVPMLDDAARSLAWYGEFLQPQLDIVAKLLRPGAQVVEAECGIGAHTLFLARAIGPAGHLFAYEHRPVVQRILRQNLDANRLSQSVTLMRRTLAGPRVMSSRNADAGTSAHGRDLPSDPGHAAETLDELLLDRLDLLKVGSDAPAAEILDGASKTLWRLRPMLFVAAPDAVALANVSARAREHGYRCWRMATRLFNPANFNRREDDIFDGLAALALVAIPEEVEVAFALDGCAEMTAGSDPQRVLSGALSAPPGTQAPDSGTRDDNARITVLGWLRKLLR